MSLSAAAYQLLIGPLELFFEIFFAICNRILENPGVSIIFLSLAMNFLVLPLYKMADEIQAEEQATEARLRPWVTHIKKTFHGDERFMMLQTFYRQNGYKPTDPLKGSISLLLEVPFFLAAYNFLSDLQLLQGTAFGPIADLGAPDGLLVLGTVAVNVLPILMTVINLVSSAIYTKGSSLRTKIQLYVMAGLFLVLLYDSPAGLVFYWTLNNLFSLVKNVFMKIPSPRKVFCTLASVLTAGAIVWLGLAQPLPTGKDQLVLTVLLGLLLVYLLSGVRGTREPAHAAAATKGDSRLFFAGAALMTVLTGVMIPTAVIHASPQEFLNSVIRTNPLRYILSASLTAAGTFLVWAEVFYHLAKPARKKKMAWGMMALCAVAAVNFVFFGRNYGNMSAKLCYDLVPAVSPGAMLLNLAACAAAAGAAYLVCRKKPELMRMAALLMAVASLGTSAVSMSQIRSQAAETTQQLQQTGDDRLTIPLSREDRNVIVLMLDRGINAYVPYLLNEKPQLREQFDGFTYYPNTLSFGAHTNFGSPGLFGGYEYVPEEMNRRDDELLVDKQNEALSVLPLMFSREGFETTVTDPPCAGYKWIPDISVFDRYPQLNVCNSMGQFDLNPVVDATRTEQLRMRNFFCYSLFRTVPQCIGDYLYDGGRYNELERVSDPEKSETEGVPEEFMKAYSVLANLTGITEPRDGHGTFLVMTNNTTHEPTFLQAPDYVPAANVNNAFYDATHRDRFTVDGRTLHMETERQITHYQVNMAAFLQLGRWFDYLREQDVYDNTRIIIVSDHGMALNGQIDGWQFGEEWQDDVMFYNALLLVKDFDAEGFTVDDSFMTNADTPNLAITGVLEDRRNPFSGKEISSEAKNGTLKVCCSHEYSTYENNGTKFHPGRWFSVKDNIFDMENWEYLGVE